MLQNFADLEDAAESKAKLWLLIGKDLAMSLMSHFFGSRLGRYVIAVLVTPRGCSHQQRWDDKPACRRIDGADKDDRSCWHYQGCQVAISGAISGASSPSWPRQCSIASARSSKASAGASLCRGATTAMVALRRRCSLVSMISPFKKRRSRNGRLPRASAFVCNQWETLGSNRAVL